MKLNIAIGNFSKEQLKRLRRSGAVNGLKQFEMVRNELERLDTSKVYHFLFFVNLETRLDV